ncbi:taurine transporter subunit [Escherichia coli]|nr:taurine transporter subunit [Escherichia coli]
MSVLINEKLHSRRLKWRWPLSRQVTLSTDESPNDFYQNH